MNKTPIDLPNAFYQAQTIPTRDKQAQATAHLRHAKALGEVESWADALQHISKALDCVPELVDDTRLQSFVGRITKQNGERMTQKLANPATRTEVYRLLNQVTIEKPKPAVSQRGFLLLLIVFVLCGYLLANSQQWVMASQGAFKLNEWKQIYREVEGVIGARYYVILPDTPPPAEGYPALWVLYDVPETPESIMLQFASTARTNDVLLIVPAFSLYNEPYRQRTVPGLRQILQAVELEFDINPDQTILFGYGKGGELASVFAQEYPNDIGGIVTSGASYLHPFPDNLPYRVLYGQNDPLLNSRNGEFIFMDRSEWQTPLNYNTIEGLGRVINHQQVAITMDLLNSLR